MGGVDEGLAGADEAVERGAADFGEDDFFGEVSGFADEDAGGLGHALDDEAVGHDGEIGIEIVEMLFGERDVFDRHGGGLGIELHEFVDPDRSHGEGAGLADLGLHVVDHGIDGEQGLGTLHRGIFVELGEVGEGHAFFEFGDSVGGDLAVFDEAFIGHHGGEIFGEEFAAGDFEGIGGIGGESFFEAKDDVEEVDGFGAEVFAERGVGFDFVFIDAQCVHENALNFLVDIISGHGHKLILFKERWCWFRSPELSGRPIDRDCAG